VSRPRVSRSGIPLAASPETHDLVLEWMATIPPPQRRAPVLDCPAGRGALAHELAALGFQVVAADLGGEHEGRGYARVRLDLNRPLPFADATFSAVTCIEGIEHLERPVDALREFRRVLVGGGALVLTTPNVLHLGSRVRMLLTGFPTAAPRPFDPEQAPTSYEHIMLLAFPLLVYFLRRAGFAIERMETNRVVKGSLPWAWLAPVAAVVTRLALGGSARVPGSRWSLTDRRLLFGHTLCVFCRAK